VKENRKTSCRLHPCLYCSRHTSLASFYINETFGDCLLFSLIKEIFVLRLNWSNLFKNCLLSTISIKTTSIIPPWQPKQYALFVTIHQFEKFAIRNTSSEIITNPSPDLLLYQPFKSYGFLCAPPPLTLKNLTFSQNKEWLLPSAIHTVHSW